MNQKRTFSDEELVGYLDGEIDHVPAREIEAALARDADLAKRLAALKIDKENLYGAFDALTKEAPTLSLRLPTTQSANDNRSTWRNLGGMAAAAAVALTIGLTVGRSYLAPEPQMTWVGSVANYQVLYGNDTLAAVERNPDTARGELTRVGELIGKDLQIDQLSVSPQLHYKRAQILSFQGKPLAQLAFQAEDGTPIALCIISKMTGAPRELGFTKLSGLQAAIWGDGEFEYLLIGGTDRELIASAVKAYRETI